jgi:hypothetical protein
MAKKTFNIEEEYAGQSGQSAAEEQPAAEEITISSEQVTEMRALKDAGDMEGLGNYIANII